MIAVDLSGKVALVTGGSRGLGKAMVMGLARAGAKVIVASRKLENRNQVMNGLSGDVGEAAAAFLERRKTEFGG